MSAHDDSHNRSQSDEPSATRHGGALVAQLAPEFSEVESIRRFQSLEPGYYWTSQKAWGKSVADGDTLLLMDLTEFDGKVHSVELRVHPRAGVGSFTMLVQDFLDVFLPCPDADAIRQREQMQVMQDVSGLQQELMLTQASPQAMMEAVSEDVARSVSELEREAETAAVRERVAAESKSRDLAKTHRRAARRSEAKGNPLTVPRAAMASDVGSLIGAGINETGVAEMRKMASHQAVVAGAQARWLQKKTAAITAALSGLAPYVAERAAVALARSSGAVKMAERIKRGIESLDLYTGKGVDVFDICTGADAPSSEPLTLVQGKRYAEEEFAVWADVTSDFDYRNKTQFFDALAANTALMEQVLPTPRCVVTMAMTRSSREYGNPYEALMANMQNQLVFLLVRNGQNVHVVYSSSPSHEGAPRLFPTQDDLEQPFRGWDGSKVSIRDVEFGERSKGFDNIALCYRRFLILLCGLDHRLGLLGQFYPLEQQMQFMTVDFQERYMRFLADEESAFLLGEPLQPLEKWMAAKNAMLQSGSRVFVLGNSSGVRNNSPELKRRHLLHATDAQFSRPFVAFKDSGQLTVSLDAVDRYAANANSQVKCALNADSNDAHVDAWWLCVDAVGLSEVRRYRASRIHRGMGIAYLRLFRRVEAYIEAELAQERPARDYLRSSAVEFGGLTTEQATASLDTAVRNWRASRRGAALPGLECQQELNEVLTLMVPEGHISAGASSMLDAYVVKSGVTPLLLTRSGKAKLVLYASASADDKAPYPDILTWGWVRRITLEPGKTKMREVSSTLAWLTRALPASEVELRRWEGLDAWLNAEGEPMSLRKYASVLPLLAASKEWDETLRAGPGAGIPELLFDKVYAEVLRLNVSSRSKYTIDVLLGIPVAAYSNDGRNLEVAYLQAQSETVLYAYGNEEQRQKVAGRFNRSQSAREKLKTCAPWRLITSSSERFVAHDTPMQDGIPKGDWAPKWGTHSAHANYKCCKTAFPSMHRRRKGAGPSLQRTTAKMSLDRALAQLNGTAPVFMKRAFHARMEEAAQRAGSWAYNASCREETEEQRAARVKLERATLRGAAYVHAYKAALSPLVWSAEKARPVANAVFVAPMLGAKSKAA